MPTPMVDSRPTPRVTPPKPEWQRALIVLTATVVAVVLVGLLFWARTVFIPITLAIFLAFILDPGVERLERRIGRTLGTILVTALSFLIFVGAAWVITSQITSLATELPDHRPQMMAKLNKMKSWISTQENSRLGDFVDEVQATLEGKSTIPAGAPQEVVIRPETPAWMAKLNNYGNPIVDLLGQGAFTFIMAVFILFNKDDLRNRFLRLLGNGRVTTTTKAMSDASARISSYLLMQLILNVGFGIVIAGSLFAIGLQYALLWGFIASILRYVPYIGTWLGVIPATIFSLAVSEGFAQPIMVIVLFLGLEAFCNNVLEPRLYGTSLGLSSVALLASAAVWGFMWGPIGLILSGPLSTCFLLAGKYFPSLEFLWVLLGDEETLERPVQYYQRLTASDEDEAARIIRADALEFGEAGVFDRIMIPALSLLKKDRESKELDPAEERTMLAASREIAAEVMESKNERDLDEFKNSGADWNLEERPRVLICPARDAIDHSAGEMLSFALDKTKWEVEVASSDTLSSELLTRIQTTPPKVIVIAGIPPGGLTHTRYLCKRLSAASPETKIIIGRWSAKDPLEKQDSDALMTAGADRLDTNLAETVSHLDAWRPAFVNQSDSDKNLGSNAKIGIATA